MTELKSKYIRIQGDGLFPGVIATDAGVKFTASFIVKESLFLNIYTEKGRVLDRIDMVMYHVSGNIYSVLLNISDADKILYDYTLDGKTVVDPYERNHTYIRAYGEISAENNIERSKVYVNDFDWQGDKPLKLDFNDIFAYSLHVRGFTKHSSSKVKAKGTYSGIIEKIDYLKSIGVNQIILMPSYEFYEYDSEKENLKIGHPKYQSDVLVNEDGNTVENKDEIKLNYWGFKKGYYFSPKASYAYSKDFVNEFKLMVRELHKASIEVIMQFFFPKSINVNDIAEILRFWHVEYHVDGFSILGNDIPKKMLVSDNVLSDAKLYFEYISPEEVSNTSFESACMNHYTAEMSKGFYTDARRFLKSDDDSLSAFVRAIRYNPSDIHRINYLSCYEGFTLNDLVTYDYKHNEANNEDNRDGTNYNYSWNCGVEGPSKKKAVVDLRLKQIKNALVFLLLSQATPMIYMGDERLRTQRGNNNPYCHDNDITWLNWKLNKQSEEILEYVKALVKFRHDNILLHQKEELKLIDYKSLGYPDVSYHQDFAWKSRMDSFYKHIGVMYAGKYLGDEASIYVAYNMHWENHLFGLPKLEKDKKWEYVFDTSGIYNKENIEEELAENKDSICVYSRSILVLKESYVEPDKIKKINKKKTKR